MNKKEFQRLIREMRDDASQRPLHEKGVWYSDEPTALRDLLGDKPLEAEPGKRAATEAEQTKEVDRGIER